MVSSMEIKSIEWAAWRLSPDMGEGARECRGLVAVEGQADVVYLDVSASPDASPVYSACWRSNGHQPSDPELVLALGLAATERAGDLERIDPELVEGRDVDVGPQGPVLIEYGAPDVQPAANGAAELVIGAGRSWTAEALEPPPVEPDPPQDALGAASDRANAAAARDLAELEPDTWGLDLSLVPRAMRPAIRQIEELVVLIETTDDEGERAELEARLLEGGRDTVLAIGIYCHVLGFATGQVQAEASRLGARAQRFRDRGKRLRHIGRKALDTCGVDKPIESPTITVGPSSGKPRVVVAPTFDVDLLPAELVRRPPAEPVKTELAKLLRRNPNAYPGITLEPGEPTLRIYK